MKLLPVGLAELL